MENQEIFLCIETATANCSVALTRGDEILAIQEIAEGWQHDQFLLSFVQQIFEQVKLPLSAIDAVVLSKGPGSYTGLRIGAAVAKAFCYALSKPLLAINTLEAMVFGVQKKSETLDVNIFCPMIDARRMEVYCLLQHVSGDFLQDTQAIIVNQNTFEQILQQEKILFFGDGAAKCTAILNHFNAIFLPDLFLPSASFLPSLALKKYKQHAFEDVAYFEPFYLKDFIKF